MKLHRGFIGNHIVLVLLYTKYQIPTAKKKTDKQGHVNNIKKQKKGTCEFILASGGTDDECKVSNFSVM